MRARFGRDVGGAGFEIHILESEGLWEAPWERSGGIPSGSGVEPMQVVAVDAEKLLEWVGGRSVVDIQESLVGAIEGFARKSGWGKKVHIFATVLDGGSVGRSVQFAEEVRAVAGTGDNAIRSAALVGKFLDDAAVMVALDLDFDGNDVIGVERNRVPRQVDALGLYGATIGNKKPQDIGGEDGLGLAEA